ncbi:MAG: asparagine synthase-related protein, partial [Gaiellaceae bacterium]
VSLAARQGVTVALSGTGGDELFAGYPWFLSMIAARERDSQAPVRAAARALIAGAARLRAFDPLLDSRLGPYIDRARGAAGFVEQYSRVYQIFGPQGAGRLVAHELRRPAGAGRAMTADVAGFDELSGAGVVDRVSALCLRGYTANQLLRDIDAVSMAHSLEVRVPYLDPVLADLALSLPPAARVSGPPTAPVNASYRETGAKRVLIDAAAPFLPAGFDDQPKRGFGMPFGAWLNGPLSDVLADTLSEASVSARGLLDPREVARVRDHFLAGGDHWSSPWLLMMLELWCRVVLDGAAPVPSEPAAALAS